MAMLTLVVPGSGADYADLGIGFFGELDLPLNPLAVYLPGSNFGSTVLDQTGNGFDAVPIGTPARQPLFSSLSTPNCFETPITGNTLVAAGDGSGLTLIGVARAPSASNGWVVGNYAGLNTDSVGLNLSNTFMVRQWAWNNGATPNSTLATDANRGNRWGFYAGVVQPTQVQVFERHAGASLLPGNINTYASKPIGGAGKIRLGGGQVTSSVADPADIAAVALYPRALSAAQVDTVYAALSAFLTPKGIAV